MRQTHVWLEGIRESNGRAFLSATVEMADRSRVPLWYNVPAAHQWMLCERAEPFVLATLFTAMRQPTDLVVHGDVAPSLLRNLTEYQGAWVCWNPTKYKRVEILVEREEEPPSAYNGDRVISAFSGGVDSCFTVFRHRTERASRLSRNVVASVMVQGHDIPLEQPAVFQSAVERSAKILNSLGVELVPVVSNFRELRQNITHAHAALIASCLWLFQTHYAGSLIPSTEPYNDLVLPWGSNPITDWLLSSDSFRILHDGAEFTRNEKVREIANWPEALRYLRVCWEGTQLDRNCGVCEKCIRTILNFRVNGLELPPCFEKDVSDQEISRLTGLNEVSIANFNQIVSAAKAGAISRSWVSALEKCVRRNRRLLNRGPSLKQKLRQTARNGLLWLRDRCQGRLQTAT